MRYPLLPYHSETELDSQYRAAFEGQIMPAATESVLSVPSPNAGILPLLMQCVGVLLVPQSNTFKQAVLVQ